MLYAARSRYKLLTPLGVVRFQEKNPNFAIRNPDFLLNNVEFIIIQVMWPAGSLVTFFGILILLLDAGAAVDPEHSIEGATWRLSELFRLDLI